MDLKIKSLASSSEKDNREKFEELFLNCPIPLNERISNLGIFVKRQDFTKQLFFNDLYQKICGVHGVIMEFGVRWGQNLVTLNNLRGIHEPFNYSRKIIGFDTFEGFKATHDKDGQHEIIDEGSFNVTSDYDKYLENILQYHETESPLSQIKKNTVIRGNAIETLKTYLEQHPETIIAFAYFDFDIYKPTVECLKMILPYLTKGSIIGFDELVDPNFPGETVAMREVFGSTKYSIKRSPYSGIQSYLIID